MDALHGRCLNEKALQQLHKNAASNVEQVQEATQSFTATCHSSRKLSKLDEPDTRDTAGEVRTNSQATFSRENLYMQRQGNHLEPIYNSSVPIQDIALKTSWNDIDGSGRSALAA